ncbi:MAG: diguanylate cyclase, partial [Oxalobacteraceae bacterium]
SVRLAASEKQNRALAEAGAMVIWRFTSAGTLVSTFGWSDLTGQEEGDALGHSWKKRIHPYDLRTIETAWQRADHLGYADAEFRIFDVDDNWRWVRARGTLVRDEGIPSEWIGVLEDIDARRRDQAHIAHMALHDSLTGLGNRAMLRQQLSAQTVSAVLCIDLDRFKQVNDTLGHAAGDELLVQVANRLIGHVPSQDAVIRLGGDEFAILQRQKTSDEDIEKLADILIRELSAPYQIMDATVVIGATIGIAAMANESTERLMQMADIALYEAKAAGRGRHHVFTSGMGEKFKERGRLERELREGIAQGELELYYQPLINTATRDYAGRDRPHC